MGKVINMDYLEYKEKTLKETLKEKERESYKNLSYLIFGKLSYILENSKDWDMERMKAEIFKTMEELKLWF